MTGTWRMALVVAALAAWGCTESPQPAPPEPGAPQAGAPGTPSSDSPAAPSATGAPADEIPASGRPAKNEEWKMPTDAEWRERLTPEQYHVMRQQGTERAFTGELWNSKTKGKYACAGCGQHLFHSETKFDSGTGWPSFWAPIADEAVGTETDRKFFMARTEVHCSRCGSHLGHVFDDGPAPTNLRYCINSVSLELRPDEGEEGDESEERREKDESRAEP